MQKKTGRNDPCPCGSGKKYKHCCWAKDQGIIKIPKNLDTYVSRLDQIRYEQELIDDPKKFEEFAKNLKNGEVEKFRDFILKGWNIKKLRKMSTQQILRKLASMNIKFNEQTFRNQVQGYDSAIQLAEDRYYTQNYYALREEEDFIWLAIIELWNRITPEKINVEMIDELMQDGYVDIEKRDYVKGIERWEKTWEMVKRIVPTRVKSVEESDDYFPYLTQYVSNWCSDFEMELGNAGLSDESFYMRRIKYCRDFIRTLPNSDETYIINMLIAEAESYAALKDSETADKLFKDVIDRFPHNPWGYISWGDAYCFPHKIPADYDKAEKIYKLGLTICDADLDIIEGRLLDLEAEREDLNDGTEVQSV